MKIILTHFRIFCLFFLFAFQAQADRNNQFGYYLTKEDYLQKKLTIIGNMQESENYNVGILMYKDSKNVEHKVNCIKEKYWGFRYIDSCDYMYMDGFYAKIVIVGRIDLLISPKATYKIDAEGKYWFYKAADGKINLYYLKDLDPSTEAPFEKLIADEKAILKEYQGDRDNYGEFINKQLKYLMKYNAIVPKPKKGVKK
ncbi:MAG: hypothetical protein IPP64_07715 [Bacteroidetes bacterium]|nr:hypothetical protein [Bacteroidota bacterium]